MDCDPSSQQGPRPCASWLREDMADVGPMSEYLMIVGAGGEVCPASD
jgi:hypothetical protein